LNAEFQQLIGEITRQATNVGLNTGGIYNKAISTYIGGSGNAGSNAMITTDLSAAAVDATALNLSTASVLGGGNTIGTIDLNSTTAFKDPTHKFMVGGSATFTFNMMASDGSATTQAITLNGGTAGLTKQEILTNLNTQLQPYGISATFAEQVAGDGKSTLAFAGSKNFSVVASAVTAGTDPIVAVTNTTRNNALYRVAFGAKGAASAGEQYAVTTADGHAFVVDVGTLTDNATTIAAFNAAGKAFGVTMVNDVTGTGMLLASSQTFTLTKTNAGGGTDLTYGALLNPTAGTSDTGSALAAIQAISAAVTKLGQAQGVVGAGQNKLQYAIALAQSQISNFSAAESRIRDADVAAEAANLTKAQVLQQASMAAMAQANSAPQAVLSLLRG
jgi:flagellin